jgi:hypothetical protein
MNGGMNPTNTNHLPGLNQLRNTPEILRLILAGISDEEARWKPAADRFSIAEILEHLSHVEGHCFRARVEQAVEQAGPVWEAYDQDALAAAGQYSGRDPEDSFDHFEEQREDNIEFLEGLPDGAGERKAQHAKLGTITISELLNEWAFHDLGHIRQIAEIVRALKYYPNMGPFRAQYTIRP